MKPNGSAVKMGLFIIAVAVIFSSAISTDQAVAVHGEGFTWVISPQPGFVRFAQPQGGGGPQADNMQVSDGWSIGALVHGIHKRIIFEVYPFYAKIGEIKTIGNIAYLDVYPYIKGNFSINAGFGLVTIFNCTDTVDTDIISPFPLVGVKYKFGKYGSYLNPWVGFMYDMVNVDFKTPMPPDIKERYKSILFGARFGYKPLPFINLVAKFYYKRCFADVDEKNTVNLVNRTVIYFSEHIGATTYLDYRQFTDGGYLLMFVGGPAFVF